MRELPEGWTETTLGEVVERVTKGTTPKTFSANKDDINYIKSDALGYNGRLNIEKFLKVTPQVHEQLKRSQLKENDILLSMAGAFLGKTGLVTKEMLPANTNQAAAIISTNINIICYTYLWYKLRDKKTVRYFNAIPSQSAQPNINFTEIKSLPICLPPLPEQKAIAEMLSSFDDKIELLREQNKTLETLAQTIFKEWFVHFNFPVCQGTGRPDPYGKPYRNNGGAMVASELGLIPQGWRLGKISDLGKIVCGKTPSKSKKEYFDGDIPFIKIPDMHNNMFIVETTDTLTQEGKASQALKTIPKGSISVSCIATVGLVSISIKESQTNQQINTIIPKAENLREFIFLDMQKRKKYLMDIGSGGTATLNVNTGTFSNIEVMIPSDNVLVDFSSAIFPMFEKVLENCLQAQTLSKTRDSLLPKLMSGDVRVQGAMQ